MRRDYLRFDEGDLQQQVRLIRSGRYRVQHSGKEVRAHSELSCLFSLDLREASRNRQLDDLASTKGFGFAPNLLRIEHLLVPRRSILTAPVQEASAYGRSDRSGHRSDRKLQVVGSA